jgi:hypothetical protein
MTIMMTRVPLAGKEPEALLWGLSQLTDQPHREPRGPDDPLAVLLSEGHERKDIVKAATALHEFSYDGHIVEPLTDLDKAILRVSVENSTWLYPYGEFRPEYMATAKKTLRDLAAKLEMFGIEVNHLPND